MLRAAVGELNELARVHLAQQAPQVSDVPGDQRLALGAFGHECDRNVDRICHEQMRWLARQLAPGMEAGWTARLTPMILQASGVPPLPGLRIRPVLVPLPVPVPAPVLDRIEFEAWWTSGGRRKTMAIETYKRGFIAADMP